MKWIWLLFWHALWLTSWEIQMSADHFHPPLSPRNGRALNVLGIVRISGDHQDELSLEDQQALHRRYVAERFDGQVSWTFIASRASGEIVDRLEVAEAESLVDSGRFDLVILEDLGRYLRRVAAVLFCEHCEDMSTRLIAINDNLDTAQEDWRFNAVFTSFRHELYNRDTAKRIRRSLRNRFQNGGIVQCVIFGYIKPKGCTSDDEVQKDPAAEPIYREWFQRLEAGATFSEIADWLNAQCVPTGPFCRSQKWDCKMVSRITHDSILKGVRVRNKKMAKRVNKTGRRKSVNAPEQERLERNCPHLAFFSPEYYDRVIALVDDRNAKFKVGKDGNDPRRGRPKKRSPWPGQHVRCAVCRRLFRHSGPARHRLLTCRGACEYRCWNSLSLNNQKAASKLGAGVMEAIATLPDFDDRLRHLIEEEQRLLATSSTTIVAPIRDRLRKIDRELGNVKAAIREHGYSAALGEDLKKLEPEKAALSAELAEAMQKCKDAQELVVPTADVIRRLAFEEFQGLAHESPEFSRIMRRLISRIDVAPYRLADGGQIVLRAKFALNLAPLVAGASHFASLKGWLKRELEVDLFDLPQRVRFREQVMQLRAQRLTEQQVAKQLGITTTVAQQAAKLDRLMRSLGITDPYQPVLAPPDDYGKLRRHRHPRYRFEPLREEDAE